MQFAELIRQIKVEISDDDVTDDKIINCLRSFCLINAEHPRAAINLATKLNHYFRNIQNELPHIGDALDNLLFAKRLSELPIEVPDPNPTYGEFHYLQSDGHAQLLNQLPNDNWMHNSLHAKHDAPQMASCIAVVWVSHSLLDYISSSVLINPVSRPKTNLSFHSIINSLSEWSRNLDPPLRKGSEIIDLGFSNWLTFLSKQISLNPGDTNQNKHLQHVIEAANYLIELDASISKWTVGQKLRGEIEKRPPTYARNFELRNLLKSHWFTPTQIEIKILRELLIILDKPSGDPNLPREYDLAVKPDIYEILVIGLALCTGHTVAEILNCSVNSQSLPSASKFPTDFFQVALVKIGNRPRKKPWLFRTLQNTGPNDLISFALPSALSSAILNTLYISSVTQFEHLLPLSYVPWEIRCNKFIEEKLSVSSERARLLVRDFLSKQIFEETTNESVVRLLCDQSSSNDISSTRAQVSLSHYLDMSHVDILEAYTNACSTLFACKNPPKLIENKTVAQHDTTKYALSPAQFRIISERMVKRIINNSNSDNLISTHNAIAEYTLFLLVTATGHRKSKTPFYYQWDICIDERLAFICDKQVIGSEARIVPLPKVAIDQYCAYLSHLRQLHQQLSSPEFQDSKNHIETLLESFRLTDAPSTTRPTVDPLCSQFFWIDDFNKPQTISTDRLNKIIQNDHARLTIRDFRSGLACYIWREIKRGVDIQTLNAEIQKGVNQRHIERLRQALKRHLKISLKHIDDGFEVHALFEIIQNTNSQVDILRFRKGLADYLWRKLKSGTVVQAWLGHASEFHSFGESSTWSILSISEKIRPHIDNYLDERGLRFQANPSVINNQLDSYRNAGAPSIKAGRFSYEGRAYSKQFAAARAKKALIKLLPEELIEWQQNSNPNGDTRIDTLLRLDTPLYERLEQELINQLGTDSSAIAQVTQTLNSEIRKLGTHGVKVNAPKVNLFQTDPGPIHINFSRHIRIASELRHSWVSRYLGQGLGRAHTYDANKSLFKRLAHLAINLIIFDATLDPIRVKALTIAAILEDGIKVHPHTLTLRAKIRTSRDIYDWLILPSPLTSALLFGILRTRKSFITARQNVEIDDDENITSFEAISKANETLWKEVIKEINISLKQMQTRKAGAINSIDDLCLIFRPWWQLRLPGTLTALAAGDYVGPAPSIESENNLFGMHESLPFPKQDMPRDTTLTVEIIQRSVKDSINEIFRKSEAILSRTSRKNLRHELQKPYEPALLRCIDEQPIVRHALGFIEYLLEVGGPHKPILRFKSIRTYYSNVIPMLIDAWWDVSFTEWTGDEFNEAYQAIFKLRSKEKTLALTAKSSTLNALRQFHRYLRDSADVPFCSLLFQQHSLPAQRRSDLVTRSAIELAIEDIHSDSSIPVIARLQAKALITFTAGYGLRNSEAMALSTDSFKGETGTQHIVAVNGNEFSDTKSGAARRIIGCPLMSHQLTNIATKALDEAKLEIEQGVAKSSNRAIIAIDQAIGWSRSLLSQRCIASLRRSNASNTTVLHTLRHTFATAVMLELFKNEHSNVGLISYSCNTARSRLVGTNNENTVHDLLQIPVNWPFGVDSVAQVVGHTGVSTLLNFYFHGAPILLAEHIHGYSNNESLIDDRIALLLNISRTAVVHRRKVSRVTSTGNARNLKALGRIEELLLVDFKEFREPDFHKNIHDQSTFAATLEQLTWAKLDDLLMDRVANKYSLESLKNRTNSLDKDSQIGEHFVNVYSELVQHSSFDDFEFEQSELTSCKPKHMNGVARSREERRKCLRKLESACFQNSNLHDELKLLTKAWSDRVDPANPWLVLKNESEGRAFVSFCKALEIIFSTNRTPDGVSNSDLKICSTGHPNTELLKYFSSEDIEILPHTSHRFSRSTGKVTSSEIGIQFLQRAGSNIGDGRDAHRLLLVLAVALNTFS